MFNFFPSRSFLKIFNLDIYRTKYYERVERNFWLPFIKEQDNHLMKLYEEGLKRSEGEWSDRFSKKTRKKKSRFLVKITIWGQNHDFGKKSKDMPFIFYHFSKKNKKCCLYLIIYFKVKVYF